MDTFQIQAILQDYKLSARYHKHLYPSMPVMFISEACKWLRDKADSNWLFDMILLNQSQAKCIGANWQRWYFRQRNPGIELQCIVPQWEEGFKHVDENRITPLPDLEIWVLDGNITLSTEF